MNTLKNIKFNEYLTCFFFHIYRKREEKLQKAAAAREVAEKVKAASAVKIEKEKEEKFKQTQLEKEKKLREEIAKKKLITHQKLLENEERRKQEEAARLAKIKEQVNCPIVEIKLQ